MRRNQDYREHKTLEINLDSAAGNETIRVSYLFGIEPEEKESRDCPGCPPVPYVDRPVYQGVYDQDGKRLDKTELQEQAYAMLGLAHFRSNEKALAAFCYEQHCDPLNEQYRELMRGRRWSGKPMRSTGVMARHHAPDCVGV